MAKTFRPWDIEQQWLMPPSQLDFVPADHPAHFVQELSDFRKRHIVALARLFVQVLRLCREAGLVKLGHVA
ncbi:MAG TPA: hypothetical protein VG755_34780, partial [Nannocystaceae bacterium]|nr:hypothetical protein [Nannocystaceae bacterium]